MAAQVYEEAEKNLKKKMKVFVTVPRISQPGQCTKAQKVVSLEVSSDDTVASLKATLHDMAGIPPRQQRLVFACSALPDGDDTTLGEHGVVDSAMIQLVETKMQVFVKYWNRTLTIGGVESSDTVESFRLRLLERADIMRLRPKRQRITLGGRILEDGHTLAKYGVGDSTTLTLSPRHVHMRGRAVELDIEVTYTVGKIKELVEEAEGVPVACQSRVYYRGKDLDDDHALTLDGSALWWVEIECLREEECDAAKMLNKAHALPVKWKTVKRRADLEVAGSVEKVKKKMKEKPFGEIWTVEWRHFCVILVGPELEAICPSSCDTDPAS